MPVLLTHQAVTHPATVVGTAIPVGLHDQIRIEIYHGFNEAAANTNPASFLFQTTVQSAPDEADWKNEDWVTQVPFTVTNATPVTQAFAATEPAGETAIEVVDASIVAAGEIVYLRDATLADSEWAFVQEVDTTPAEFIHLFDGITRGHAITTTSVFSQAEKFSAVVNLKGVRRFRLVYQSEGAAAANAHIKAFYELIRTRA